MTSSLVFTDGYLDLNIVIVEEEADPLMNFFQASRIKKFFSDLTALLNKPDVVVVRDIVLLLLNLPVMPSVGAVNGLGNLSKTVFFLLKVLKWPLSCIYCTTEDSALLLSSASVAVLGLMAFFIFFRLNQLGLISSRAYYALLSSAVLWSKMFACRARKVSISANREVLPRPLASQSL